MTEWLAPCICFPADRVSNSIIANLCSHNWCSSMQCPNHLWYIILEMRCSRHLCTAVQWPNRDQEMCLLQLLCGNPVI